MPPRVSHEEMKALLADRSLTYLQIAERTGYKLITVVKKAYAWKLASVRSRKYAFFIPDVHEPLIRQLRREGKPNAEIAKATGLALSTIQHITSYHGVYRAADEPKCTNPGKPGRRTKFLTRPIKAS